MHNVTQPTMPNVVLLHGMCGSKHIFSALEEQTRQALQADTLAFDLLGFGENKRRGKEYTLHEHLGFINDKVQERFAGRRISLVGHSLGGVLALAWAVRHGECLDRLILLNTPLGYSRDDIVQSIHENRSGWGSIILDHPAIARASCLLLCQANFMRLFRSRKPFYVTDQVFNDYRLHWWKSLRRTFENVLVNTPAGPLIKRFPILNIVAEHDISVSRRFVSQPNISNIVVPGGHCLLLERPNETIRHALDFLAAELQPPSSARAS